MAQILRALQRVDNQVHRSVRERFGDKRSVDVSKALSWTGEHAAGWLALGVAGAIVDSERRGSWLRATAAVAGAHAASMAVKRVVRRPRPNGPGMEPLVKTAGKHSFPSSHATSSAAAVVAFAPLLPAATIAPVAGAVCFSRLVVGVHYMSDVVGGAALGAAVAAAGRSWITKGRQADV
ncbi:phosphatase PAP2 family protein [Kitasatospora sp. NPDC096128]|uniref:phosphatase PAP2 family protein n=1 Tax=Kitasatospora sp. NPDC096128 TaxID=3155547 RepID=UPI00332C3534